MEINFYNPYAEVSPNALKIGDLPQIRFPK